MMPYPAVRLIFCIVFQVFIIAVTASLKLMTGFQPESWIYPCCCIFLALTIWSFFSWYFITKTLFHPYTIFLLAAVLFNGGQAILEVFHLNKDGLLRGQFSGDSLANTLFFVVFSICTFHLGALLSLASLNFSMFLKVRNHKFKRVKANIAEIKVTNKDSLAQTYLTHFKQGRSSLLRKSLATEKLDISQSQSQSQLNTLKGTALVGWGLAFVSFGPAVYVFSQAIKVVLTSGYQGLYQGDQVTSVAALPGVLAGFVAPAAMFLLAGSQRRGTFNPKWARLAALTLIFLYIFGNFFLGERNKVATRLLAFSWLWHAWIQKIPSTLIVGMGLGMSFLFPFVAATRNAVGQDRFSIELLLEQFSGDKNPLVSVLNEMGGSMMTVAHTIELVPGTRDFQWGADYWYALLTLMPNLFWDIHPTIARGIAGEWLTWTIDPYFAMRGGGYGYSFIAEAYLNFGWVGGPLFLGALGFAYALFTLWATNSNSPARIALIGTFSAFFPFYARSEMALHVRALVWYALIPYYGAVYLSRQTAKFPRTRFRRPVI